jgi:DNA invertase Pin-like site-specific DNA recombinase
MATLVAVFRETREGAAMRYVAYYRVSTAKQAYGLEAQQSDVRAFLGQHGGVLEEEFIERKSGEKDKNRPELQKALAYCRKHKCRLLLAKLDRVSRDVEFIAWLMKQVPFTVVSMPNADPFQVHIWAALAQQERTMIAQRTKAGLKVAKANGKQLGGLRPGSLRFKAEADQRALELKPLFDQMSGLSAREIAEELNKRKVPTANGCIWHSTTVLRMMRR